MSYIEDNLNNNENIEELIQPSPTPIIIISIIIFLHFILLSVISGITQIFTLGLFITTIFFGYRMLLREFSEFGITNVRVISKLGIISREVEEMNLESIESIKFKQSILGRILQYGTIQISGRGVSDVVFKDIDDPAMIRKKIDNKN